MNKVEIYERSTFRSWTDGPKTLIDMQCISHLVYDPILNEPKNTYAVDTVEEATAILKRYPGTVGTIYIACYQDMFTKLVDVRPDLDVRLLVV